MNDIRDIISEYNKLREYTNEVDISSIKDETEINSVKAKIDSLKELKDKIKSFEDTENCKVRFDSNGYAEYPTGQDYNINFENLVPYENGGKLVDSKFKILNSSNINKVYPNSENLDLGNYVKGALTGQWGSATKERDSFKALSTGTGTVLIPQSLSAQVLAEVMNKSLIYRSGVPVVDMPNGNLDIAKVVSNPTYGFKEELQAVTPQDATFEGVTLKGKMVYGLMKVSLEVLHSASNLSQVLKQAMSDSIADAIDKAMLYGTGTTDIKGIFNYDTINTVEATGINYASFVNAVGKIREKNGEPSIMGINAKTDTSLNLLVDNTGNPIVVPKVVDNLDRIISNNLRSNLGNLTDESEAIVYDPRALIIGNQVQLQFETSRDLGLEDGSVYLRIYGLLDMALLRPEYITHITKLK